MPLIVDSQKRSIPPEEFVTFETFDALEGVIRLAVDHSPRHWRWHHETYTIVSPIRPHNELVYLYRGRAYSGYGQAIVAMEPGETSVVKKLPGAYSFRSFFVSPETVQQLAEEIGVPRRMLYLRESLIEDMRLVRAFQRLNEILEQEGASLKAQVAFNACLGSFMERVFGRSQPRHKLARTHANLARDYLRERFLEPVRLSDLAKVAGVSPFHLARAFSAEFGIPPHQYQIQLRLSRGRQLLASGESVETVAASTGFADASHFVRVFKREMGVTPGIYLRSGASTRLQFCSEP